MSNDNKNNLLDKIKRADSKTLIILFLLAIIFLFAISSGKKRVYAPEDTSKTLINKSFTMEGDKDLADKIALEDQIGAVGDYAKNRIETLEEQNKELLKKLDDTKLTIDALQKMVIEQLTASESSSYDVGTPYITHNPSYPDMTLNIPDESSYDSNNYPSQTNRQYFGGIRRIKMQDDSPLESRLESNATKNYFPSTTILKGTLINGLYAPTLSKGKSSPVPAIIRIDDLTLLPNEIRKNISGCRLLGEAYGELSDSRAHIRLQRISCAANNGESYIDSSVKGVVFGEDGTLGVRGDIVANFNKILVNSFFMRTLSGLGDAVKAGTQTTIISDTGSTRDVTEGSGWDKSEKVLIAGVGDGVGGGFKMISDFYLSILREMGPVIQVNGGREIEVVFTEGIELNLKDSIWDYGDY